MFFIGRSETEDQILQKLISLRAENESNELDFFVESIFWSESISQEIILTFEHFVNSGRQWNKASFFESRHPETSVHLRSVLQAPVTTKLFRELIYSNFHSRTTSGPIGIQLATALAFVLRDGRRAIIVCCDIGNDAMSVLSDGLVTRDSDVSPQEHELCSVSFLNDDESSERRSAEQCLADGLALNKTLTSLCLRPGDLSDSTTAMIVRSLIGHPSLRKLDLGQFEFGELTTRAICCLLASSTCKLSDLRLSNHVAVTEGGARFDVPRFIEQLPVNTSIQSLELSHFGRFIDCDSANQLLRSLWKFPSLKRLGLTENAIEDFELLASGLTMTTPNSRLRVLVLDQYRYNVGGQSTSDIQKKTRAIRSLLDVFPELGVVGVNITQHLPASVIERMDLNRCSGMLLRGKEIALSVWAVVLAKVNTDSTIWEDTINPLQRKANVIYHMLHGPVFEGRGSWGSETDHTASLCHKCGGQSELSYPRNKKHKI